MLCVLAAGCGSNLCCCLSLSLSGSGCSRFGCKDQVARCNGSSPCQLSCKRRHHSLRVCSAGKYSSSPTVERQLSMAQKMMSCSAPPDPSLVLETGCKKACMPMKAHLHACTTVPTASAACIKRGCLKLPCVNLCMKVTGLTTTPIPSPARFNGDIVAKHPELAVRPRPRQACSGYSTWALP